MIGARGILRRCEPACFFGVFGVMALLPHDRLMLLFVFCSY